MNIDKTQQSLTRLQQAESVSPLWPQLLKHNDVDGKLVDDVANLVRLALYFFDPSPVTDKALKEMGIRYNAYGHYFMYGIQGEFSVTSTHCYWCSGVQEPRLIKSIGQLRRLVSGLGVEL
jgi:hypothetical protein